MPKRKTSKKKPNPFQRKEGKEVEKKKRNLSPEERKRRSDSMKKRQEEGKVGAKFGKLGGRPKKKRASEVVAEQAAENADEIAKVFVDAMRDENPESIRLKGAEGILKVEEKESRLAMDEEEHLAKMNRDDLLGELEGLFGRNPMVLEMFKNAALAASAKDPPIPVENLSADEEIVEAEIVHD